MTVQMLAPVWSMTWKIVLVALLAVAVIVSIILILCLLRARRRANDAKTRRVAVTRSVIAAVQSRRNENKESAAPERVVLPAANFLPPPVPYDISQRVGYVPQPPAYTVVPTENDKH